LKEVPNIPVKRLATFLKEKVGRFTEKLIIVKFGGAIASIN